MLNDTVIMREVKQWLRCRVVMEIQNQVGSNEGRYIFCPTVITQCMKRKRKTHITQHLYILTSWDKSIYNTDRHPEYDKDAIAVMFCQITKVWILWASIDDDICCGKQTDRKAGSSVISAVCVCRSRAVRLSPCHRTYVWDMEQLDVAEG